MDNPLMLSLDFPPLYTERESFRFVQLAIKVLDCVILQTSLNICKTSEFIKFSYLLRIKV